MPQYTAAPDELSPGPPEPRPVTIVADHRELRSQVPDVLAALDGIELSIDTLAVGDYVVDGRVAIERRTMVDFSRSIIDTRLFQQAARLSRAQLRPAILLEGTLTDEIGLPRPALQGALISLSLVFDIPVLRSADPEESAHLLAYAARQLADAPKRATTRYQRTPKTLRTRQLRLLASLPGVGGQRARALLEHFGSVARCLAATEKELAAVPGIGPRTARDIRQVVEPAAVEEPPPDRSR